MYVYIPKVDVLDEKQSVILEYHVHIIALDGNIDTSCEQGSGVEVWNHIQLFYFIFFEPYKSIVLFHSCRQWHILKCVYFMKVNIFRDQQNMLTAGYINI
jgi:hypothetical protein